MHVIIFGPTTSQLRRAWLGCTSAAYAGCSKLRMMLHIPACSARQLSSCPSVSQHPIPDLKPIESEMNAAVRCPHCACMMCVPLARPGLALRRCIMHGNYVRSTIFSRSFTRDSQTTVCLGLLVVCCFSHRGLLMYAPSCTPHPSYTQMINQRLYIYVERRCGQSHRVHTFACRYSHPCVCMLPA